MGLGEDAAEMFRSLFGDVVAKQLKTFDDPSKYPEDFLDDCSEFMAKFIGKDAADKKMAPLYAKYLARVKKVGVKK